MFLVCCFVLNICVYIYNCVVIYIYIYDIICPGFMFGIICPCSWHVYLVLDQDVNDVTNQHVWICEFANGFRPDLGNNARHARNAAALIAVALEEQSCCLLIIKLRILYILRILFWLDHDKLFD